MQLFPRETDCVKSCRATWETAFFFISKISHCADHDIWVPSSHHGFVSTVPGLIGRVSTFGEASREIFSVHWPLRQEVTFVGSLSYHVLAVLVWG